jgi:hypothetical protein
MEELKGGLLITAKEVQRITGFTLKVAQREHRCVRDSLGKKSKRLTVKEYCNYFELDYQEIVIFLNSYR